jgi:transcriptional regulator with XRE-family HTH domain
MGRRGPKPDLSKLTPQQTEAATLLADPNNKMTQREIAKQVGVHYNTIGAWKKKEEFRDLIEYYRDMYLNDLYGLAIKALENQLKRNSTRAVELFFRTQGKLRDRVEMEQTVEDRRDNESLEERIEELKRRLGDVK